MTKLKDSPNYIKNLLMPTPKTAQARRVWSIDLETVWLPFFTATNAMGDTAIPLDALGCPIRLGYEKDGSVKFTKTGRPVSKVAKPIADSVTLIRQNFVANLQDFANQVAEGKPEEYANQVELAQKAGQPIIAKDKAELDKAIRLQIEEALREAQEEKEAQKVARQEAEASGQADKELVAVS